MEIESEGARPSSKKAGIRPGIRQRACFFSHAVESELRASRISSTSSFIPAVLASFSTAASCAAAWERFPSAAAVTEILLRGKLLVHATLG